MSYTISFKTFLLVFITSGITLVSWRSSGLVNGFSIEDYCDFFTSDIRPIVCVLKTIAESHKNATNNTTAWEWEEDCSCDLSCWPKFNFTSLEEDEAKRLSHIFNSEEWFYNCNSCGSKCWLNESSEEHVRPRCSCALIGSSRLSKCSCAATCATFRSLLFEKKIHKHFHHHNNRPNFHPPPPPPFPHFPHHHHNHHHHNEHDYDDSDYEDDDDDEVSSNCIFAVNNVYDGFLNNNTSRGLNCDCGRSKRAETTNQPDFVCICQHV